MDKLNVALHLIQLLNERKSINSRIVADELNVSLRTAQRYLSELSLLPCVMNLNNNHTFAINPEYKLNEIISNGGNPGQKQPLTNHTCVKNITTGTCLLCASTHSKPFTTPGFDHTNNLRLINRLAAIIEKKLKLKKCGYRSIKPFYPH